MDLKKYIRSIPDYPKKGILFRDITTLIKDKDAFKVMSVQPEKGSYPKHYFTIFGNQSFNYDKRLSGTENPSIIINKAFKGQVRNQNNSCYKGTKKGLLRIKQ